MLSIMVSRSSPWIHHLEVNARDLHAIHVTGEGSKANVILAISLPGAVGMFGLSIGISKIDESLPRAVYAVLSGLNAATVGVVSLAAVELSNRAITDRLTRILVFLAAT